MPIFQAIRIAAKYFPNCRIANCECDSYGLEWVQGCGCLCHLLQLQKQTGLDINLVEFGEYQELDNKGRAQWLNTRHEQSEGSSCANCNTATDEDFTCTLCGADCCSDGCRETHEGLCELEEEE